MQLTQVRTNTNFALDYDTNELKPQIELILLFTQPKYESIKKGIVRSYEIKEARFTTNLHGINTLIGELQATVATLNNLEQLASGLNAVIKASVKPKE